MFSLAAIDPQQMTSTITALIGVVGSIIAFLRGNNAKKEAEQAKSSVHDMIAIHEAMKRDLENKITQLENRDTANKAEIQTLRDQVAKCETESAMLRSRSAQLQIEATQLRTEAQLLSTTNASLMSRVEVLRGDLSEIHEELRSKQIGVL